MPEHAPPPQAEPDRCGSNPPKVVADAAGNKWTLADCWCSLPAGHDGQHQCQPCSSRYGTPGWQNIRLTLQPVEGFDRDPNGQILVVDERGEGAARLVINVPLKVEPPEWWQPYQKPTRDQLLAVLKSVQELADEQGERNTYIERARLRAVLDLAREREGVTDL